MLKPKTHFEQIPVKAVKKIAEKDLAEKEIEKNKPTLDIAPKKLQPYFVGVKSNFRSTGV
jgi:hypothetical protein